MSTKSSISNSVGQGPAVHPRDIGDQTHDNKTGCEGLPPLLGTPNQVAFGGSILRRKLIDGARSSNSTRWSNCLNASPILLGLSPLK